MSHNRTTVERYFEGFRNTDRQLILSCLTTDVEWELPGIFRARGKEEFDRHIVDEGFRDRPGITVHRFLEVGDVLVAEGSVRGKRTDGTDVSIVFCDVFEMENGAIRRLTSYIMETKDEH